MPSLKKRGPRPIPDITGKIVGTLKVLERAESSEYETFWNCRCQPEHGGCGNTIKVRTFLLRFGRIKSCGCKRGDGIRAVFEPFRSAYNLLSRLDENRRRETMSFEDFLTFTNSQFCYYCGDAITWKPHSSRNWQLDRVDNSLGHIKTNCVPCCRICNRMKSDLTREDFLARCERIVKNLVRPQR